MWIRKEASGLRLLAWESHKPLVTGSNPVAAIYSLLEPKSITASYIGYSFLRCVLALDNRKIIPPRHKRKIPVPIGDPHPSTSIKSFIVPSH
jgi:hypothetical protein